MACNSARWLRKSYLKRGQGCKRSKNGGESERYAWPFPWIIVLSASVAVAALTGTVCCTCKHCRAKDQASLVVKGKHTAEMRQAIANARQRSEEQRLDYLVTQIYAIGARANSVLTSLQSVEQQNNLGFTTDDLQAVGGSGKLFNSLESMENKVREHIVEARLGKTENKAKELVDRARSSKEVQKVFIDGLVDVSKQQRKTTVHRDGEGGKPKGQMTLEHAINTPQLVIRQVYGRGVDEGKKGVAKEDDEDDDTNWDHMMNRVCHFTWLEDDEDDESGGSAHLSVFEDNCEH